MTHWPAFVMVAFSLVFLRAPQALAEGVALEENDEGVTVTLNGEPFTQYLKQSGHKPILFPIIGPTGTPMTRSFPMEKVKGERPDHPHHRSLWFTHGDVNGIDFWSEGRNAGKQVHREYKEINQDGDPSITAIVDWIAPDGKKILEDERKYTFRGNQDKREIDFQITLKAGDEPVKFGDTKEGTFGIRIPTSMDITSRRGGEITTSEKMRNGQAWGKPAAWVDYHGPVEGETVGIAILNHPSSFNFPTRWHVRDYGLFAANPFGRKDFPKVEGTGGEHTLQPGESVTLKYRVIFHRGNAEAGHVAESYTEYADSK